MSLANLYKFKYPDLIEYKAYKVEPSKPRLYKGFTTYSSEEQFNDEDYEFSIDSELEGLHRDTMDNLRHAKRAEEEGKAYAFKNKLFLVSKEYVKEHGSLPSADSKEWLELVNKALQAKRKRELEPKFEFDEDLQKVLELLLSFVKHGKMLGRVYKRTVLKQFDLDTQKKAIEDFYESFGEYSKKQGNYATFDDISAQQIKDFFEREVTGYKK